MNFEQGPADRLHQQSPEELLTPETYQLATAMANRLAYEAGLDYPKDPSSEDNGNFDSALHEAISIGEAAIALQRLEDPTAEVNAQSIALWCTQDKVLNELVRKQVSEHYQAIAPEVVAKMAQNVEAAKSEIVQLTNRTLREAFELHAEHDLLQAEVEKYLKILPACKAEAESFGVPLQKVFENDGLYARAIQASYTPEEFISEQKAAIDFKDGEFEERMVNDALAKLKTQGKHFKGDLAEQKAVHKFFKKHPEYQEAVMQFHHKSQQIARNRFTRYWGEDALANLPSNIQAWLRV